MSAAQTEAVTVVQEYQPLSAAQHRAHVNLIQQVMSEVMDEGVHFGRVPGSSKPSLWKPGAEILGMTFHIAIDPSIDADLSTEDCRRYRIRAAASSQQTGAFLGAGLGTCSSDEEKYKWRKAVCDDEFEETPVDRRRKKWKKDDGSAYAIKQVRTEPADIDNTVLKMAVKRAVVAVILQVTAASDCFTQDIEDMPDEIRDEVSREKGETTKRGEGESKPASQAKGEPISDAQRGRLFAISKARGFSTDEYRALIKKYGYDSDRDIPKAPKSVYDSICAAIERGPDAA